MANTPGITDFPAALDSHTTLVPARDLATTTLTAPGVTSATTTFPVTDTSRFPSAGLFTCQGEHVTYTGKTISSLTGCTRERYTSLGGSIASAHAAGTLVQLLATAVTHEVQNDAIIAIQNKLGISLSTPIANRFLRGTGTGTSAWQTITPGDINTALGFTPVPGIAVEVGDAPFASNVATLDWDPAYFSITESPAGEINISFTGGAQQDVGTLVISGGIITLPTIRANVSSIMVTVDTEGAAASDDLDQINVTGSVPSGINLIVGSLSSSRVVTVRHNPAKINLDGGQAIALNAANARLTLTRAGGIWTELSRQPMLGSISTFFVPTGVIMDYGGVAAPAGWLLCNGASYLRSDYPALFAVIQTAFGAVDGTHFNVPDLRDRYRVGVGVASDSNAVGKLSGAASVQLTSAQSGMPAHAHSASAGGISANHTHGYSYTNAYNSARSPGFAQGGNSSYLADNTGVSGQTGTVSSDHVHAITVANAAAANAAAAHENRPPSVAVTPIIKV